MQPSTDGSGPPPGILGSYSVTLAESDLPASVPHEMYGRAAGTWGLAFHEGNRFVVSHNGAEVSRGTYRVSGDKISFAMGETGPYACKVPATYAWRASGGQLTFTPVGTDGCQGRRVALTTRPYTRTP